ncbi:ABC transporter substrate-binding protein [Streptomyces spinosirectus]|jgi:4,5-dihydroxyphthalate decarboxylase|uniref:4,5-dihydroxyphthalate decarboxylase n=1 Tax=Streptomyces TaxID=1883 RepID=UPI000D34D383|nr:MULTISPECIES: 4,5-dihydroxyphthalate decarboxylase [Streptomyces]MBY8339448.1 ABC transporter substrate-binding protein [Streptomyces plumbidurans]PTM93174.1 4,5-dihydroxyphthalate decarboxylase [Streptomyces sp. VMFN-G11Ma]UIR16022.1 ABC transporter substrate-binding protein [Streptomyces spinosirectus]
MSRLQLTFACGDYDRTRALEEGTIRPDGIELTYLRLPVEETFFRMMRHQEFEVAEMSLSSYVLSLRDDPSPFVALPVYTSRMFRHGSLYCHADSGINTPEDLRGKRIGTPEYQLTACVWMRGILADRHNVPFDSVSYLTGGQETPGRIEKAGVDLPDSLRISRIPEDRTLAQMLAEGEIDALCTPRVPSPFTAGDPRVRRVFPDVVAAEKEYYTATGIFPVMHVVVIRRDVYDRHRWVAQSLYKALLAAKNAAYDNLYDTSALRFMLPWLTPQLEEARELMGRDYWSYGVEGNRETLATFLRYHHEQGLSARRWEPEELFAPESLEAAVI